MTANALAEEKQRCLESGMDSCLSKPVTLDVLKQTLSVYAERVRKRDNKKARKGLLCARRRLRGPAGFVGRVSASATRHRQRRSVFVRCAQRHGREIVQQGDIVIHTQLHHRGFFWLLMVLILRFSFLAISVTRNLQRTDAELHSL